MIGLVIVDAFASRSHYLTHIGPVWRGLPVEQRGHLLLPAHLIDRASVLGVDQGEDTGRRGDVILVASWDDAATARAWGTVVLMEHGVGQGYSESHAAYAGGSGRCGNVDVFLCPNERVAALNREACPDARVEVVGTPWLDELARIERVPDVDVAVSFHWDLDLCPETRCTFDYWGDAVAGLARQRTVLGHGHPRAQHRLFPAYELAGIPTEPLFEMVVPRVRVYACDNSSTMFYAAALGIPVVVLNGPRYRRHVNHGLRFWECADIGVQVEEPGDLADAVDEARITARTVQIVGDLCPHRGEAVGRAVAVLVGG